METSFLSIHDLSPGMRLLSWSFLNKFLEGKYLWASPAIVDVLGYEPHEVVGQSAYKFFHPLEIAAVEKLHRSNLAQERVACQILFRARHKNGTYVDIEIIVNCKRKKEAIADT